MPYTTRLIETPIGRYRLVASAAGLTHVKPEGCTSLPASGGAPSPAEATRHVDAAARALAEYFAGERSDFSDLRLAASGTAFERRVWNALCAIPFGRTASYGEIARRIGCDGGARAVGNANRNNPLAIVVPCHRVIGSNRALTGYAGGLRRKRWLLEHEAAKLPAWADEAHAGSPTTP